MGRPWNWKDWFAQTDRQARELVDAIDKGQKESRARPPRTRADSQEP
jgi:hypothetical protein